MSRSHERNPMARVMGSYNFRLLMGGSAASLLGDQFALIATPWLVLRLTHDPLALGTVLALGGIPRAALMLFGGAISDRFSPRRVMLVANIVRLFLASVMATLVWTSTIQIWMVFLFSVMFGIVAGFAVPAENSIVPRLVGADDLQAGNSIIMGLTQLAGFVGPTIAGILIGSFAHSLQGVSIAFAIDAVTFLISAITLQCIRDTPRADDERPPESVWGSTLIGLKYLWADKPLRLMCFVLLLVNVLLMGPLTIGIPILADRRLPEGATAFGLLMSAFAIGNLIGYAAAGTLHRPHARQLQWIVSVLLAGFGLGISCLSVISYTWIGFGVLFLIGLGNGFMAIILVTWMQNRTHQSMHGRMMGLIILFSIGLVPVSQAAAGALSSWNLTLVFVAPGGLVLVLTAWLAAHPVFKTLGTELSAPVAEVRQPNDTRAIFDESKC